ncbi:putative enzyme related to lactoylglutathione lyase [Microbacterium natoriense]|uniref:Enzyme related to lactoylglutathione lyase n=1 Tax=Microbacterium natoriense TaxID=284570 RepID=A0AAW8F228_9MICO|nr:VOC family protein [Microbacterium natoriense]MDQ0649084.1 putative enzyme related to lactoylglutathione lyase [Microbacterium natoriense]
MTAFGPDFISLQSRDRELSAAFYEEYLGLVRVEDAPPHAVVFATAPIAFAIRDAMPGVDLDAADAPGLGISVWMHAPDAQSIHDALAADGRTIAVAPFDGPFGRTFTFVDLDGYQITLHDRA